LIQSVESASASARSQSEIFSLRFASRSTARDAKNSRAFAWIGSAAWR